MIQKLLVFFFSVFLSFPLYGQIRSFDDLFPDLDAEKRNGVFSADGFMVTTRESREPRLIPRTSKTDIASPILSKTPSFIVESLLVLPHTEGTVDLAGIYNALGKIQNLKGRLYHSATRDRDVPLFEDATRLAGPDKLSPIPDAPAVFEAPPQETMYIRLRDINFGNSYYRADIAVDDQALLYRLSNFRNLSYLFFPVIREGKFIAQMYIEPLVEGILVYSIAGADVSDFIASRIDIPSAVQKRLEVIIGWVTDGIGASDRD
jgi:hypothetical protein